MTKNDNINIKIEVCKEKNSGRLSMIARFDSNAPNVAMDRQGYFWIPTFEEKEFINEAFELMQMDNIASDKQKMQRVEEKFDDKPLSRPQKIEKQKEQSVFERSYDKEQEEHFEKRVDVHNKKYEDEKEQPTFYEKGIRKKEERVIVEADDAAIEAALKRHMDDDKSFVEVDEQTIIDRVLSQKKKGKWNNNK